MSMKDAQDHLKEAAEEVTDSLKSPNPNFHFEVAFGKGTAFLLAGGLILVGVNMIRGGLKEALHS